MKAAVQRAVLAKGTLAVIPLDIPLARTAPNQAALASIDA